MLNLLLLSVMPYQAPVDAVAKIHRLLPFCLLSTERRAVIERQLSTAFIEQQTDSRFAVHTTNNRWYSFGSGDISLSPKGTILWFSCSQLFDCSHSTFTEEQVRSACRAIAAEIVPELMQYEMSVKSDLLKPKPEHGTLNDTAQPIYCNVFFDRGDWSLLPQLVIKLSPKDLALEYVANAFERLDWSNAFSGPLVSREVATAAAAEALRREEPAMWSFASGPFFVGKIYKVAGIPAGADHRMPPFQEFDAEELETFRQLKAMPFYEVYLYPGTYREPFPRAYATVTVNARTGHAMTLVNMTPLSSVKSANATIEWPAVLKVKLSVKGKEHALTRAGRESAMEGVRILMLGEKTYYGGVLDRSRRIVGMRSGTGWDTYSVSEALIKEAGEGVRGASFGQR